jgi:hypothetical protein
MELGFEDCKVFVSNVALRMVPLEHNLHDQVRNLRMELSDLKIQVSDLAAAFGRE